MKLTPTEKRSLLTELIELMVHTGYDISDLIGRPLYYFDYDKIKQSIIDQKAIYKEQNETTYDEYINAQNHSG